MKAKTRRKLEMGARALAFSRAHPDPSPGYAAAVARLEALLARGTELANQQWEGIVKGHSASVRKRDLRRTMRRAHLAHLIRVARIAAVELPELRQKFVLQRGPIPYLTFRTAARGLAADAESRKELLVRHGLADTILESLTETLQQFDQAVDQRDQWHRAHVGASVELDAAANEVVRVVKALDALNIFRFAHDSELLASWKSASNVVATPRPAAGDISPAA
jgi:hypothetical protein